MDCLSPSVVGKHAFPCGKCMPCRLNKREEWVTRILLEGGLHAENAFVTLTYDPKRFAGPGGPPRSVSARDLTLWFKRLRKLYDYDDNAERKLRYFACGEYGDKSGHPHYHAICFGMSPCKGSRVVGDCECPSCADVRKTWGFGHVLVGSMTEASARYLSKYVAKRWTHARPELLGRTPEIFRVSKVPGLGAGAMPYVARSLEKHLRHLPSDWVPRLVRIAGRKRPLGRYLRSLLAKELGREIAPLEENSELRMVREFAWDNVLSVKAVYEKLRAENKTEAVYREKGSL